MDVEKVLDPNSNELNTDTNPVSAKVYDAELDPIHCEFHDDDCVTIDTRGWEYICLSIENLKSLLRLIKKAKKFYQLKEEHERKED